MLEELKKLLNKEPFESFRIVTTSGKHYDVTNPDSVALMDSRIFVAIPRNDDWAFIRLTEIVALESISKAA